MGSHFILVHGLGHGAWCWYKLAPLLRADGHGVTTVDLAASGVNTKTLDEVRRFADYNEPLLDVMASLPANERVVLVGHSYGGLPIAMASERFPEKVAVAVFITAAMPSISTAFSTSAHEFLARCPPESFLDSEIKRSADLESPQTSVTFGTNYIMKKMYHLCSVQDQMLATMLLRPGCWFLEDPTMETMVSRKNYGSVSRVYVIIKEDRVMTEDFQRWIVNGSEGIEVEEIYDADHLVMLSNPQGLSQVLLKIAQKYK